MKASVPMSAVMVGVTATIRVTGVRAWKLRVGVGVFFLRLGLRLICGQSSIDIQV